MRTCKNNFLNQCMGAKALSLIFWFLSLVHIMICLRARGPKNDKTASSQCLKQWPGGGALGFFQNGTGSKKALKK
jgi:hypothetical protein